MRIKIKDSDNVLSQNEQQAANQAMKVMNAEDRETMRSQRVVYWNTQTQRIVK